VDTAGVVDENLEVAHVLGCDGLGMECQDGWIHGLEDKKYHAGKSENKFDDELDAKKS
jgi:hypothetical protein